MVVGIVFGDGIVRGADRPRDPVDGRDDGISRAGSGCLSGAPIRRPLATTVVGSLGTAGWNECQGDGGVLFSGAGIVVTVLESSTAAVKGSSRTHVLVRSDRRALLWDRVSAGMARAGAWMNWESICRNADRLLFRQHVSHHCQREGGMRMSQATIGGVINGVDVEQWGQTVQAVQSNPSLGTSQFRVVNRWINGGHNRSTIKGFYGAGQEDTTRTTPFVLDADEPLALLGKDHAANPAEYVLHALAACLTTSLVYHAAARGIHVESIESKLEGDLDLRGFLGVSPDVRKGFQAVRVNFTIKSNATADQLAELAKFSPVYDTLANPVPVSIHIESR